MSRRSFVEFLTVILCLATTVSANGEGVVCTAITQYTCGFFESQTASGCFFSNRCEDVDGDFECPDGVYNYNVNLPLEVSGNFSAGPGQSGNSSYSKAPVVCVVRQPCTTCEPKPGVAGKWCFAGPEPYSDFRTYERWTPTGEPCTGLLIDDSGPFE